MPVLSYIHQLFNADTCHVYIHTLRWKDRPLQCPRCQSQDVDPWGTYHSDLAASAIGVGLCVATERKPGKLSYSSCS
jgi:hypothetical protein